MAGFGVLISIFIVTSTSDGSGAAEAASGPGAFDSAGNLSVPGGFLTALGTTSQLAGIVLLSLWATAAASDYDTGLNRVLVQAQPNRLKLLGGKIIALTGFTVLATAVTTLTITFSARPLARLDGIDTEPWRTDFFPELLSGYVNFLLPSLVWGLIGLFIAVRTRSSGVAIAAGIGYLLVVENLIAIVADDITDFLPGGTLAALAGGGTADLAWAASLGLTLTYGVLAAAGALLIFRKRDITS
ncbi:MAG: ABC-2 type transport system permease protein [Candidatus Poriferisodalaceae bacterium]|jgi:ABC-2 type transport system permease protein